MEKPVHILSFSMSYPQYRDYYLYQISIAKNRPVWLVPELFLGAGVLGAVAGWIDPATAVSTINTYAGGADRSAAIAIIGGADGPTAIFVSSYSAQTLWGLCVKVFSNVIVVVLNYVFSKLIIFKKKK